ncbi:MAG: hypothetical protein RLN76_10015 [Phycisphaeraceae bacterium]
MKKLALLTAALIASPAMAADVTPDVIFGSGNANGSFTVDQNISVELGLRAKLRHGPTGAPANVFNYDGTDTYYFVAGVAPTQSFPTAEWSFEWSINSDFDGSTGWTLGDLTYELAMTSDVGTSITAFDPINAFNPGTGSVQWDHAMGDNSTGNGAGVSISNGVSDAAGYATNIGSLNVAQNSWKPHWFTPGFNPNAVGNYDFTLKAFTQGFLGRVEVASTSMTVQVVPTPAAFGAGLIGMAAVLLRRRSA